MELWTYLVFVHAVAAFSDVELERTWLKMEGPFQTLTACQAQQQTESETAEVSQCMPLYQAESIAQPYNQGAFVLQIPRERT